MFGKSFGHLINRKLIVKQLIENRKQLIKSDYSRSDCEETDNQLIINETIKSLNIQNFTQNDWKDFNFKVINTDSHICKYLTKVSVQPNKCSIAAELKKYYDKTYYKPLEESTLLELAKDVLVVNKLDIEENPIYYEGPVDMFTNTLLHAFFPTLPFKIQPKEQFREQMKLFFIKNVEKVPSIPDFTVTTDGFHRICVEVIRFGEISEAISEEQMVGECLACLTYNYIKCLNDNVDFNANSTIVGLRVAGTQFSFYALRASEQYLTRLAFRTPAREPLEIFKEPMDGTLGYNFLVESERQLIVNIFESIRDLFLII